jgi:hypothetical protein
MIDRKVNMWMEWHMQYFNAVSFRSRASTALALAGTLLDTQMCFDKAMDMTGTLKPTAETKKYSTAESLPVSSRDGH